jgi:hypothetical protein
MVGLLLKKLIGKHVEGTGHPPVRIVSWYLPGVTNKNKKNLSSQTRFPSQELNQMLPEHKSINIKRISTIPTCLVYKHEKQKFLMMEKLHYFLTHILFADYSFHCQDHKHLGQKAIQ